MPLHSKSKALLTFLQTKLSAITIFISTFAILLVTSIFFFWLTLTHALQGYLNQQTEVLGNSLATQAAFNATQSILTNDLLSLNVLLTRLVADENIISARVYNKKDELLAEASNRSINTNTIQEDDSQKIFSSIVKFRQENVGHVIITLDKTPAQATLSKLGHLLLSVGIFIGAICILITYLVSKFVFNPIKSANRALVALNKGNKEAKLTDTFYKEAYQLHNSVLATQKLDWHDVHTTQSKTDTHKFTVQPKPQIEFNFDQFFEEDKQRNCVLYIKIENVAAWQKNYTQLQIANLFTPVYRAMFQASRTYFGNVYQYDDSSAVILFSASDCDNQLYVNAICTASLFKGLMDNLMQSKLYKDTPAIEYKIAIDNGIPEAQEKIKTYEFKQIINKLEKLISPFESTSLALSEEIFSLPEIQNKVFTSLPEILADDEGKEILTYAIKYLAKSLTQKIDEQIDKIIEQ